MQRLCLLYVGFSFYEYFFRRLYSRCTVYFVHVIFVCAQVSLRNFLSGISHFCGGSIIHPSWILTAGQSLHHRVHRVATAAFWRTFSHEGKIGPGWWGWGVHAYPLLLHLPSPVKLQCTLQLSGQTNPISSLGNYVLCGLHHGPNIYKDTKP